MKILAIDPGPVESAYVIWDGIEISAKDTIHNDLVIEMMIDWDVFIPPLIIEQVRSYGMAVGATVFDTVFWSGRFCQAWPGEIHKVPRMVVNIHICHKTMAKDTNIIHALVDRFAYGQKNLGKGKKKEPGFFYGFKDDIWQAFALAVMWKDQNK